jgi:predicted DNA binding CopG/RHH family protein
MRDAKIDFSDIPELSDAQLHNARRVGRPKSNNPKQLIAVRLSPALLAALKKLAKRRKKPYQTLMHELLEKAVKDVA